MANETEKPTTFEEARAGMARAVYVAVVKIYEDLEHRGLILGNGRHAAQKLAEVAIQDLVRRWVRRAEAEAALGSETVRAILFPSVER